MRTSYDKDADALHIRLVEGQFECRPVRVTDDISLDFTTGETLVGIEVLGASHLFQKTLKRPQLSLAICCRMLRDDGGRQLLALRSVSEPEVSLKVVEFERRAERDLRGSGGKEDALDLESSGARSRKRMPLGLSSK